MSKILRNLYLTRMTIGLAMVVLLCATGSLVYGQAPPLVYTVENSGANLGPTGTYTQSFGQLPIIRQLPDPFVYINGTRDTSQGSLEQHRQDWISGLANFGQGPKPACTGTSADNVLGVTYICSVTASYTSTSATAKTLTIVVTVVGPTSATNLTPTTKTLTTTAAIALPTASATFSASTQAAAGTCGPVPANGWPIVIGMTGATGSWPATAFTTTTKAPAGVSVSPTGCAATVNFSTAYSAFGTYQTSDNAHNTQGFYKLYPTLCSGSTTAATAGSCTSAQGFTQNGSNLGEYMAWAYGFSRIMDGLQDIATQSYCTANSGKCATNTALPIDITHSADTGCSYAGKMAMMTGAFDERVALVISQENGGGGAPSWRVSHEIESQGSVEDVNDTDYDWWDTGSGTSAGTMGLQTFAGYNVYKDPADQFELMALTAPRALLTTGDSEYYWLGDRSQTYDDQGAAAIYNNYGIGDRYGYYIDTTHTHCAVPAYQQNATQAVINRFLFSSNTQPVPRVSWILADALTPGAQPTIDPNRWISWWGTGTPAFPAADVWNEGGDVELPLQQSITINTGDTITSQFQLAMPGTHAAATVTVPTSYAEVDVACTDGSSYTFAVPAPLPTTNAGTPPGGGSPSAATNSQAFTIGANNNSLFPSAVASATNPGCDNGAPGTVKGTYFYALGNPNPGAGNPGLSGFQTTDGVQGSGQTDPLQVTFNLADSSNSQGGTWAPWTTINRLNPYSCDPWGCPLTPTITWAAPAAIQSGTALSATQLNAAASALQINGMANAQQTTACGAATTLANCTGLLESFPVAGTWSYNPPAGTVLPVGVNTLTATFTPTKIATDTGTTSSSVTNSTVYETYTIATASVPISVLQPPTVTLTSSATVSGSHSAGYAMTITIKNSGNSAALNVVLSAASLGTASGTPLPQTWGTIAAGGTATFTVSVPGSAGADGAAVAEKFSGSYTGGTYSTSIRSVTLP